MTTNDKKLISKEDFEKAFNIGMDEISSDSDLNEKVKFTILLAGGLLTAKMAEILFKEEREETKA